MRSLTFALCSVIVVTRAWERVEAAEFWAEDGRIFLSQALELGYASLLRPMAGSYHTLQRATMLAIVDVVPIAWWPAAVSIVCLVVTAIVASKVVRPDYAWLIPSPGTRVLTACTFCLLPGLHEMLTNLCNVNWILFAWLSLVGLKDPSRPVTRWDLVASLLVVLSIGTSVLLLPLFGWRVVRSIRDRRPVSDTWMAVAELAIILVLGTLLLLWTGSSMLVRAPLGDVAAAYWDHLARLLLVAPWVGDRWTMLIFAKSLQVAYLISTAILLVLILRWAWPRRHENRVQAVLLFVAGVTVWTVLVSYTRFYAVKFLAEPNLGLFLSRYSFPVSFSALVLWMSVIHPDRLFRKWRPSLALVLLVLNVSLAWHRAFVPRYGPEPRWAQAMPVITRAMAQSCQSHVTAPIYPGEWTIDYVAHASAPPCH